MPWLRDRSHGAGSPNKHVCRAVGWKRTVGALGKIHLTCGSCDLSCRPTGSHPCALSPRPCIMKTVAVCLPAALTSAGASYCSEAIWLGPAAAALVALDRLLPCMQRACDTLVTVACALGGVTAG